MISEDLRPDIDQAAETAGYALYLARRKLLEEFPGKELAVADCVALAAIIVTKLNMMHECDMRYIEMDRADRRIPRQTRQEQQK